MAMKTTAILLSLLLIESWHIQPSLSLIVTNPHRHRNCIPYQGIRFAPHHVSCNNNHRYRHQQGPWGTTTRISVSSLRSQSNSNNDDSEVQNSQHGKPNRRSFLEQSALSILSLSTFVGSSATNANARGLVRFPCTEPLLNTYHFLRSGSSLLEVEDIWSTNPLFLTNREAALSELGEEQVKEACNYLKSTGISPSIVRYSLAAASIDSANIVGENLFVGRDRLVPEFNYMDPRAIGAWDFAALNATEEAVWAMDVDEAGKYGKGGKPPSNEDGTPAETLADQVVRLTNLMSVLETLYSGDTVLLVFPDGAGPALLSCLMGGIPLNRVHELQFCPGEIRCDVNYNSINALASQPPSQTYLDILQRGRAELKDLRDNPDLLRNIKDLNYEEELDKERKELEATRKEDAKAKELDMQRGKEERDQERKEQEANRKEEVNAKELEMKRKREERLKKKKDSVNAGGSLGVEAGVAGAVIVALAVATSAFREDEEDESLLNLTVPVATDEADKDVDTDNESLLNSTALVSEPEDATEGMVNAGKNETDIIDIDNRPSFNLTAPLIDNPESLNDQLEGPVDPEASSSGEEVQQNKVIDYDDWEDAWLGSISEIMNDSDGEDN